MIQKGKESLAGGFEVSMPLTEDVIMFSYTSGTTGVPKGVKLTQKMVVQCTGACVDRLTSPPISHNDCYISYLPAAHSFE